MPFRFILTQIVETVGIFLLSALVSTQLTDGSVVWHGTFWIFLVWFQELEQFITRHNATFLLNDFDLEHDIILFWSPDNPYYFPLCNFYPQFCDLSPENATIYCLIKRDQLTSCVRHSLNPPRNAFSVSEVELWGGILSGDFRSSRYYCYYFRPSHFYSVQTEVFSNYEPCAPLVKLFLGVSKGGEYSEMDHVSWDDGKRVPFSGQQTKRGLSFMKIALYSFIKLGYFQWVWLYVVSFYIFIYYAPCHI